MALLSALTVRGASITVPDAAGDPQTIPLRGLSFEDIGAILHAQGAGVERLWGALVLGSSSLDGFDVESFTTLALYEAPLLVAQIIAHGAGEPDALEQAAALPIWIQVEAVEKIYRLTFEDSSPKKLLGVVTLAYQSLRAADAAVPAPTSATPGTL